MSINCPICENERKVNLLDDYKLGIKTDIKYFKSLKIYHCEECEFSFANPMPEKHDLDYYYKNIYRLPNRPPYWRDNNDENFKKNYLSDKNLNYLLYLTILLDFTKIENLYDFGSGDGEIGFILKKKFSKIKLFCTENDTQCKKILGERDYTNFENVEKINERFDLIISSQVLDHLTDINIFSKFYQLLKPKGSIFFEVVNCTKYYFDNRPYDSQRLLFFTKKSLEILAKKFNFEIINLSYSSYSLNDSHKFMKESQNMYENMTKSYFSHKNVKNFIKRIIPASLIEMRRNYLEIKKFKNEDRLNLFTNNTGDNCYLIRGIFRKN